jgi:hypothetical protein
MGPQIMSKKLNKKIKSGKNYAFFRLYRADIERKLVKYL